MSRHARVGGTVVALAVAGLVVGLAGAEAQPRQLPLAEGRRIVAIQGEQYGTLADEHPTVVRVRAIAEKLLRAAGRRPGLVVEVYVLDTPKIVGESLRGGLIVVSRGLVDLAGGDDALAFVLAHELAHLTRDHHGLLDSLGVLGAGVTPGKATVPPDQVARTYRAVELDADRLGALVAALAGYRVGAAMPALQTIVARVGADAFHPSPNERALAIRDELGEVVDHLEVFHLALYFLVTGRYLDAGQLLEQFLSVFPSREVLSAAGVAYHKEALRYAPAPEFRHLLAIDAASRVRAATRGALHPLFRQRLERAIHYYTLAVDADPGYAPALANLGAAYLDLGERELALGNINRALREDPGLASAYNNRALVALAARDLKRAEEDFLVAARLAPGRREITANLARLYEIQGRMEEARRWTAARPAEAPGSDAPDLTGAVTPGMPMARLAAWLNEPGVSRITLPLGRSAARELTLLVFSRRGLAVVSLDGQVDAVGVLAHTPAVGVRGVRAGDPTARIEAAYGRPTGVEGIQAINVWGFPGRQLAFFVVNDRVQAIWAGRPPQAKP